MMFIAVFVGSGLGGVLRYGVGLIALAAFGTAFPVGTMTINVIGSFAMAFVATFFGRQAFVDEASRLFFTTGIIGGFTTFSTFSFDAASLYERGDAGLAITYVLGSVVLSLAAFFAGLWLARSIF